MKRPADRPDAAPLSLDRWVAEAGPLRPQLALIVALEACARASRMTRRALAASIDSLSLKHVCRANDGRWAWTPAHGEVPVPEVTDQDVVERLGGMLFHALTGQPLSDAFASEAEVRARLRAARPDITSSVTELTARALSARRATGLTLERFAHEVRQSLGIGLEADPSRWRRRRGWAAVGGALLALGAWALAWTAGADRVEPHGITADETAAIDVREEAAQSYSQTNEHTAAVQEYQLIARLWGARVPADDPRIMWVSAHEAWVRSLRGDGLTAEQVLEPAPERLAATLGETHPYTRAVQLALADTLFARGATVQAAALRAKADAATRALIGQPDWAWDGVPSPAGARAHLGPNTPVREGFRVGPDGRAFLPLTSTERVFAGRDGWRLHVTATGACRASVVLGDVPRRVTIDASRGDAGEWRVTVDGTSPPMSFEHAAADALTVSLVGGAQGTVTARAAGQPAVTSAIDSSAPLPAPPYELAFNGGPDHAACRLVWLEIPIPFRPVK